MNTKKLRWSRVFSALPKQDWLVIGWTITTKLLLLVLGVESFQILSNQRITNLRDWLEIWNRWDSLHYLKLAEFGYSSADPMKAWLYPLFPWTVRVFAWVTRDYLVAAFVVSGLSCATAAVLLRRLVARDYGPEAAQRSVWFFLIFPPHISCTSDIRNRSSSRSCSLHSSPRGTNAGVDGRNIRRPLLDDTPSRHRLVADPRDRGSASVLGSETLAMAMALDRIRSGPGLAYISF